MKTFENLKPLYPFNIFLYWKLRVSIKGQQKMHPKNHQKCKEIIKILTLISLKNSL